MASIALRKLYNISPNQVQHSVIIMACISLALVLLISGCIMTDIESIISILDQENPGGFDLDIVWIHLSPENPDVGEPVSVSIKITNRGRKRSKETPVNLVMGEEEVSRLYLPPIVAGDEITLNFNTELIPPSGITTLKLTVDPEEESADVNWHNNALATSLLVGEPSNVSDFSWTYGGIAWDLTFRSPANDLKGLAKDRPIYSYSNYLKYIEPDNRTVRALADILSFISNHMQYQSYDEVSFVLAFVQDLPYTSDLEYRGGNFPRYPIETIVDGTGDCEDSSALFASIISNSEFFNYGSALLIIDDHMGVGVSGNEGVGGTYFEKHGSSRRYYFCETTGEGYSIGDMPEEYHGAEIQELIEIP